APPAERRSIGDRSFIKNALLACIRIAGLDRTRYDEFMKKSGVVHASDGQEARLFFHYPGVPLTAEDAETLDRFAVILREATELCERNGSRLVVVYIPTKFRVYGGLCRFAAYSPCAAWSLNDLPERVRALVAKVFPSVAFLDLTAPFRAEAARGPLLYYADDTHWSPEGQALAGRLLADYLATSDAGR
ncbi:MAG TPA: hypothetical protein VGH33_19185, partial [Isosphaeraceae bacterium]